MAFIATIITSPFLSVTTTALGEVLVGPSELGFAAVVRLAIASRVNGECFLCSSFLR